MDAIQPAAYKNTIKFVFYYCRDPIPSHSKHDTMKKLWKKSKKDINDIHISDYFISPQPHTHIYPRPEVERERSREKKNAKNPARNLFACTFEEETTDKERQKSE